MDITIVSIGSRGDVQPFVALALGLLDNGHQVTIAAPQNFENFVKSFGINFHALPNNTEEVITSVEGEKLLKKGSTIGILKFFKREGTKRRVAIRSSLLECCVNTELIITSYITTYAIAIISEKLNKKWAVVNLNPPIIKTGELPAMSFSLFNFPWYNKFTYDIIHFIEWRINKEDIQEFRKSLGLLPLSMSFSKYMDQQKIPIISAISSQIFKKPSDWKSHHYISGFLTLPANKNKLSDPINHDLKEWINDGDKPIYIGFGSIPFPDKNLLLNILNELLERTNLRILFCKGWTKIDILPVNKKLFVCDSLDHEFILPLCQTAIIHGGIGTITAVLKSKIPVIILSIFADQPYWGQLIERKKCGAHFPAQKINTSKLLSLIKYCSCSKIMKNAQILGSALSNENGVKSCVEILENIFIKIKI